MYGWNSLIRGHLSPWVNEKIAGRPGSFYFVADFTGRIARYSRDGAHRASTSGMPAPSSRAFPVSNRIWTFPCSSSIQSKSEWVWWAGGRKNSVLHGESKFSFCRRLGALKRVIHATCSPRSGNLNFTRVGAGGRGCP